MPEAAGSLDLFALAACFRQYVLHRTISLIHFILPKGRVTEDIDGHTFILSIPSLESFFPLSVHSLFPVTLPIVSSTYPFAY